jgi:hypothetical protein
MLLVAATILVMISHSSADLVALLYTVLETFLQQGFYSFRTKYCCGIKTSVFDILIIKFTFEQYCYEAGKKVVTVRLVLDIC